MVAMTNKKALAYILTNCEIPDDVREKLEKMLASLDNKTASGEKKLTDTQKENMTLQAEILAAMEAEPVRLFTCTELGKEVEALEGLNNQRIAALMRGLTLAGKVVKTREKNVSYFGLAVPEDGAEESNDESGEAEEG